MSSTTAKTIRDELKTKLGLTSRQVSVRSTNYGQVFVDVKTGAVNLDAVKAIAHQHINIPRDYATGEILIGGTSVRVQYTDEALAPVADLVVAAMAEAVAAGCVSLEYRGVVVFAVDKYEFAGENRIAFEGDCIMTHGLKFTARKVAELVYTGKAGRGCTVHADCLAHHEMAIECAKAAA